MQFRFVCWASSWSFVHFQRVSSRSSFRSSSFAPFGAYETCFASHPGTYCLLLAGWVLPAMVAGGAGAWAFFGGLISVRFWLHRRPSSRFGSRLVESVRIVLPLELEISFVSKNGSLVVIALRWFVGYHPPHQGTHLALICAGWCLFVLAVVVCKHCRAVAANHLFFWVGGGWETLLTPTNTISSTRATMVTMTLRQNTRGLQPTVEAGN